MIMKKKLLITAIAITALASCTSNDFVGDQEVLNSSGNGAISFTSSSQAITRGDATGSTAAGHLSNQFIVYGEKNEINAGETGANVGTAAGASGRDGHLVFKNYLVDWIDNSAYTTTSNTKGWEYVGLKLNDDSATPATTTYSTHITPNSGTGEQTIKYWDYGASSYTFTAVSALPADITAGYVSFTKTQTGSTVYDKGYTVALTANAHLDNLFFSERQNITDKSFHDRTQENKYGGNVTFRFHNLATKVRVGMYETIPGYTVTINKFTVAEDQADPTFAQMDDNVTANFAANLQNCASGTEGTLTVKYVSSGTTVNHPTVSFGGTKAKVLTLGTGLKENVTIGESATGATYDKAEKAYTSVFPNETNAQNLKLKLSYTLTDPVTHETIVVSDKTAEIPANYLKWKPGYAYTYLFKITDDDLYPITFDAVEVIADDGKAEYITTVTEPSITTFGVNSTTGKYVTGGSEYAAGSDIYATIMDASAVKDFTLGSDVNVYLVTTSDATNFPITEASVAEALAEISTGTKKITYELKNSDGTTSFTAAPVEVEEVPGEDGVNITGTHALKLTGAKATTETTAYAIEYIKTAATYHTETVTIADQAALTAYLATGKLYTNPAGTTEASATFNGEATYYRRTAVDNVGTYAYKVIRVQ